jgi:hypothetical protein
VINRFKKLSFNLFNKFLSHPSSEDTFEHFYHQNNLDVPKLENLPNPYYSYEKPKDDPCLRDDIIFITSRFRSGSTVFWNIFRNLEGCTAYYEPFNERRWFDSQQRGDFVDESHLGVSGYWKEYEGMEDLGQYYDEDWIRKNLMMDANSWQPKMKQYIEELVSKAKGRPVLQFNRIDFRLPWLKKHFPNAKIIHLYRNPRDQFCSFLTDKKLMNKDDVSHTYEDHFYLDTWCDDLKKFYPFLSKRYSPHPYQRFYFLWKLSFLHGKNGADLSVSLENIKANPADELVKIFAAMDLSFEEHEIFDIVQKNAGTSWQNYADEQWFSKHEIQCEIALNSFLENNSKKSQSSEIFNK